MNNQQEKTLLSKASHKLKKLAHHLRPVVLLGKKGVSDAVIKEINCALRAHQLIKIQFLPKNKVLIKEFVAKILKQTHALHIDTTGNIVILFRKTKDF